ncbi:heavy metal translocating P-type ATPase [Glaciecola sp. 1036]|uniref:heavy metal translocating P-type ATPase n=1 Tax=Alteromonadaceae TaxID=72275 RepID=UPI003D07AC77
MSIAIAEGCCFHCGLPNEEGNKYPVEINNKLHHMCCPGCQAVAQAIVENGLANYYEFRTEPAARGDSALDNTMAQLSVYDEPELQEEFVFDQGKHKQIQLTVEGITCAACGWLIEKQLAKVKGLKQISVNVSARRALVTWDESETKLSGILARLKAIGYASLPFHPDEHEASFKKEQKSYMKKLGLAGIMTMQVMMLAFGQYFDVFGNLDAQTQGYFNAVSLMLTTPVVFYSASVFYLSALKAIQARTVNMDVPVTIAIFSTYIAGLLAVNDGSGEVYFESICMFIFFLLISRFLEHRSRHKATEISSNMLKLIPATASKLVNNDWVSVLAKQLVAGEHVLVKAGESIPIDGKIVKGQSTIDESMLTGEFEPVFKAQGQQVYAGTVNQQANLEIEVTSQLKFAMMNQILRLQEVALARKPKIAKMADTFSRYFVSIVLMISALTYIYWHLQDSTDAFWITISVLVATCPCALGLATPSALTCAMAKLNKLGILLKRADALEQMTNATDIIFDKTGTLTQGKFSIQQIHMLSDKYSQDYVMQLATFIEKRSEHPIAKAFDYGFDAHDFQLEDYQITIGQGVLAKVNGNLVVVGSKRFIKSQLNNAEVCDTINANVYIAINHEIVAAFLITDTVLPETQKVISELNDYSLCILSGDEQKNVNNIATEIGINRAVGEQTPEGKLNYVQQEQAKGKSLIMLGDGINDAPVLAAADVSVAVGNASDLAKNAADVILINPKLNALVDLISMAKRTKTKIKQNIIWALSYNVIVLPFAVMGLLSPWQAALGMSLSSIIVVYNSTRLMR